MPSIAAACVLSELPTARQVLIFRADEVARNGAPQEELRPEVFLGAPCILFVPSSRSNFVIPNRAKGPVWNPLYLHGCRQL